MDTLLKPRMAGADPNLAFLWLRATQVDHKMPSPAELFLGGPRMIPRETSN